MTSLTFLVIAGCITMVLCFVELVYGIYKDDTGKIIDGIRNSTIAWCCFSCSVLLGVATVGTINILVAYKSQSQPVSDEVIEEITEIEVITEIEEVDGTGFMQ